MGLVLRGWTNGRDNRAGTDSTTWVDREVAGCEFRDARLGKRFRTLLEQIGSDIGQSIPFVCQDWANTKAAYRFLSNCRVSEADILSGHFQSNEKGDPDEAILEIRYRRIRILPPVGKQNRYPALTLTVIHAQERGKPKTRKSIDWKLLTDLPVQSRKDAIEKLEWYAMRWKIEMFHKILKSGCRAEESRLRTAERLANLISLFCILSWRIFWMTMLNRSVPTALPSAALTATEIELLDHLVKDKGRTTPPAENSVVIVEIVVTLLDSSWPNRGTAAQSRQRCRMGTCPILSKTI